MKSTRFLAPGSPLHGKEVPLDWSLMDCAAKRRALVACGYALNYAGACSMMGRHVAAVMRNRREAEERLAAECAESRRRTGENLNP